jgi:hypothetical protein
VSATLLLLIVGYHKARLLGGGSNSVKVHAKFCENPTTGMKLERVTHIHAEAVW